MQSVQGGSLRPSATNTPYGPPEPTRMRQSSKKKKKKSAVNEALAKPTLQGYNAWHPMEEDHDPNLQSQPRSIKGPPSIKPTFIPAKPKWTQRRGQPRSIGSTSHGGSSFKGNFADTSSARHSNHVNETYDQTSGTHLARRRPYPTYQQTWTNRHLPVHLSRKEELSMPSLTRSSPRELISPSLDSYYHEDPDDNTVTSVKRPLSTEGASSPPNHKRQRVDDEMDLYKDVPIEEDPAISEVNTVHPAESLTDPTINSVGGAKATDSEDIRNISFESEEALTAPDPDIFTNPLVPAREEANMVVEDPNNQPEDTSLGHSSKMDSYLPSPPYLDTSMSSNSLQGSFDNEDNNTTVPIQTETHTVANTAQGLYVPTVIGSQSNHENNLGSTPTTSVTVHVKEEPEFSPPIPSTSPVDVDAPEPSLYEQLGLPNRTSGAYRVSQPPSKGGRAEWLAQITEQIKWVRGRESGLKPLKIGRVFFRSDGVAIDWEVPTDEAQGTDPCDSVTERSVPHEAIEIDGFTEAGTDLTPNPSVKDAAARASVGIGPIQTAEPILDVQIEALVVSTKISTKPPYDTTVPSPRVLTTVAICFLDRYIRCFDLYSSRSILSGAYLEDAIMSFQFNDLPTEGVCPRVGNPRKQSHLIVDLARRDEARNLVINSDRDPNHPEYDQRREKCLFVGRQAIERRLTSFEDLTHWPSPIHREHQFIVEPLHELGCILVRHWGDLYSRNANNKQSNAKSKPKFYSYSRSNLKSNSNPNQSSTSQANPDSDKTESEGQEGTSLYDGTGNDDNEEQQSLSLQFDRTFILKPNSVKKPSWIDWPWVISNEQLTVFHRPGIVCQCLP